MNSLDVRTRKKVFRIVVATFLQFGLLAPSQGQNATTQDVKTMMASTNPTNSHLGRALSQQAQSDLGATEYGKLIAGPNSGVSSNGPSPSDIARNAMAAQRNYDEGYLVLNGNDLLVKGSIGAGLLLAPATGGTSLIAAAIGEGASLSLSKVEDVYQQAAQDSIRRNLKSELNQYESKFGQQAYQQLTSATDPSTFRKTLDEKLGGIFGTELDSLPKDQQDIVNHFYEQQIVDVMKSGFTGLSHYQSLQDTEIKQNRKDIKGLALTFAQFADSTNQQLGSIFATQKNIESSLQTLNNRIGKTEEGVAFMQNVMFSNMKPAEQLSALRSGLFPNMPDDQRKDLEEKIAVVAQRQAFTDQVGKYLGGASELANIAKNLGVDPKIVNAANTAVNVGNQALNAFTAFSSGNFLSGVSSLSNILGIGGPDVAAQRQQEIMNLLGKMYTKLDVIDQKVDKLLQGQQLILQTQQTILDQIGKLSDQVQHNQEQLLSELHDLHNDVLVNRQIIVDQASLHYGNCYDLVWNSSDGSRIIDTARAKYPNWSQFQKLYTNRFDSLQKCTHQMGDTRGANQDIQSVFWLVSYENKVESNVTPFLQNVYEPAWGLLQNSSLQSDHRSIGQRLSSLLAPMDSVPDLDDKLAIVEAKNPPRFKKPNLGDLMAQPISPSVVMLHDSYVTDIHYYYMLLDAQDHPRSLSELYQGSNIRETGYEQLLEALSITDIAIAQQTLVSGDALLPVLAEGIQRYRASQDVNEKKTYQAIANLLKSDSILASNLLVYMLRSQVLSKCNLLTYDVTLSFTNPSELQKCTDAGWTFHFSEKEEKNGVVLKTPKGWSLDIEGTLYAMPSSQTLLDGKLVYGDDLYKLLGWRQRLLQEIGTYEVFLATPENQRPAINNIILKEFSSSTMQPVI